MGRHFHLPAAGTTEVPPVCKDAGTPQQKMKPARAGTQRSDLGQLQVKDKMEASPSPQENPCPWSEIVSRPPDVSLPSSQEIFKELGLVTSSCPPQLLAGRLHLHLHNWNKLTRDPWLLSVVSGYQIEFHSPPSQAYRPVTTCPQKDYHLMDQEVASLVAKGAVRQVMTNCIYY